MPWNGGLVSLVLYILLELIFSLALQVSLFVVELIVIWMLLSIELPVEAVYDALSPLDLFLLGA